MKEKEKVEKKCGKCQGSGWVGNRRSISVSRTLVGDYGGGRRCPVCDGSGVNPNYREKSCERCYRTIGYHKDAKFPPKYCPGCKEIVASEKAAKQRERERQNAMWREKACPGLKGQGYCGKTIRYRVDWDRIPDICPDCRAKAKAQKAERDAKWREKPCAGGCGTMIRYNVDWEHPPNFCPNCKEKQRNQRTNSRQWTYGLAHETQQVTLDDGTKVTFGPCTMPSPEARGKRADEQREFARNGYWFVSLPDSRDHTTFIVRSDDATVVKIKARGADKQIWRTLAIALR